MSFAKEEHFQVLKKLKRSYEEEASSAKAGAVTEDVCMWQTMKDNLGLETASRLYREVWGRMGKFGVNRAVEALGIKEPYDLLALMKVLEYQYNTYGTCLLEIIEQSLEKTVAEVKVCPFWEYANEIFGKVLHKDEFELYLKDLSEATFEYCEAVGDGMGLQIKCPKDKTLCHPDPSNRGPCHLVITPKKKGERG